jgi:hypothetical protein
VLAAALFQSRWTWGILIMPKTAWWRVHNSSVESRWGSAIWGRDRYDAYQEVATWPDAPLPEFELALNGGAGAVDLVLPRRLGEIGLTGEPESRQDIGIAQMVTIGIIDEDTGAEELVIWRGYIEEYAVKAEPGSEGVVLTLVPFSARLADTYYVGPHTFTDTDPADMMRWFLDRGEVPGLCWHPSSETVGATFTQTFEKTTIREAFDLITNLAGADWGYYVGPDGQVLFRQTAGTAAHVLRITRQASDVEFAKSATRRRTQVILYGAAGIVATATAVEHDPANPLVHVEVDDRITDQEIADRIALTLLDFYNTVEFRASVGVADSNGPDTTDGLGYDLESLKPGDAVQVVNPEYVSNIPRWGTGVWGEDYFDGSPAEMGCQILRIARMQYAFDKVTLELSDRQPSQVASVQDIAERLKRHMVAA